MLIAIRAALLTAGALLLIETMLGCIYALGIGFADPTRIAVDLCLTLAFPLYLIGCVSLRWASFSLWLLFILQSVELSMNAEPVRFVNPFGWAHGDLLFSGALIVSVITWLPKRFIAGNEASTLATLLLPTAHNIKQRS